MIQVLPRQMDSLAALVAMVRDFLRAESLPDRRACDLDLVLEELFANIVRHGRGTEGKVETRRRRSAHRAGRPRPTVSPAWTSVLRPSSWPAAGIAAGAQDVAQFT
jgi:hypothetical protein